MLCIFMVFGHNNLWVEVALVISTDVGSKVIKDNLRSLTFCSNFFSTIAMWPCVLNSPPKNAGFVTFLRTKFYYINDIFAKQDGMVMLLVSSCC